MTRLLTAASLCALLTACGVATAQSVSPYGNPIPPAPQFAPGLAPGEGEKVWADMHAYHCESATGIRRNGYTIYYDDYDVLESGSVCVRNEGRVRRGAKACDIPPVKEGPSDFDCSAYYSIHGRRK